MVCTNPFRKGFWRFAVRCFVLVLLFVVVVPSVISVSWILFSRDGRLLREEGQRVTVQTRHATYTGVLRRVRWDIGPGDFGWVGLRVDIDEVVEPGFRGNELQRETDPRAAVDTSIKRGGNFYATPWHVDWVRGESEQLPGRAEAGSE